MGGRHPITYGDIARLEIDDANRLYWDGSPVMMDVKFSLPWWVNALVIAAGGSTFGMFVLLLLQYLGIK